MIRSRPINSLTVTSQARLENKKAHSSRTQVAIEFLPACTERHYIFEVGTTPTWNGHTL